MTVDIRILAGDVDRARRSLAAERSKRYPSAIMIKRLTKVLEERAAVHRAAVDAIEV